MSHVFEYIPGNQEDYMPANQQGLLDYEMPEPGYHFYCYKIADSKRFSISKTSTLLSLNDADIKPSNLDLIKRQVIYLPKAEREKLRPENRVWADFFEAHDCFMSENDYPIDTPDDEKHGKDRNLIEAMRRLHLLADGPDHFTPAQYFLGLAYKNQWFGNINKDKSIDYYKNAAAGIAEAQYTLGNLYKYAIGVPKNEELSHSNYKKAAKQGMAKAQFTVAQGYQFGTKQNPNKSFKYYSMAAEKGYPQALYELGNCFYNAYGTYTNLDKSKEYFTLALQSGHKPAEEALNRFKAISDPLVQEQQSPDLSVFSQNPSYESAPSSPLSEEKDIHNLSKDEMSQMIFTMKGQIDFLMVEMREMKKRLSVLENPKPKRTHAGKESPPKRLKLQLAE